MRRLLMSVIAWAMIAISIPAVALEGLGITLSIDQASQTEAELSGEIWVGIEQGETASRTINIRSLSDDTDQLLELELYDLIQVDGVTKTDYSKPSRFRDWVSFSPSEPVVSAGDEISVVMTFTVPLDAQDEAFRAVLNVAASTAKQEEVAQESGAQAVIKTRIALETNVWLGVGDALDLAPNYEILSVDGVLIQDVKFVRILFQNNGIVPINPTGKFQLSDPAFAERVFDPVDFESPEITQGQTGYVDVPVPEDVVDGFYRSFVTAQSGGVRKTKLFEGNLVFDDPNKLSIPDLALRIGLFILASIGLVIGVRMLRRSKPEPPEPPVAPKRATPKPKKPIAPAKPKTAAKRATPAKTAPKRPAVKKTVSATSKAAVKPVPKPTTKSSTATKTAAATRSSTAKTSPAVKKDSVKTARSTKEPTPPTKKSGAATKSASTTRKPAAKTSTAKPTQPSKTTRKTDPVSPRVRAQSKDTESK